MRLVCQVGRARLREPLAELSALLLEGCDARVQPAGATCKLVEQGQQLQPHPVAPVLGLGVARVLAPRLPEPLQVPDDLRLRDAEQRPNEGAVLCGRKQ